MRPYEVIAIFDTALDDDAIGAFVDRVTEIISSRGGRPGRVEHWGRRRLAYELRHRWEGYYVLLEALAEPGAMAEVDRMLSLADEVMRHKVIRVPDSVAGRAVPSSEGPAGEPASVAGGGPS